MEFLGLEEILVILFILLLVVGPERLPEIAGKLGRAVRRFTSMTSELSRDITAELEESAGEIKRDLLKIGEEASSEIKGAPMDSSANTPSPSIKPKAPLSQEDPSKNDRSAI